MCLRFSSFHGAHLFASSKRAEGHFAEVLDENAGHIYGPLTMGGFRVLVSEEPLPKITDPPRPSPGFPDVISRIVIAFIILGMIEVTVLSLYLLLMLLWAALCFPAAFFVLTVRVLLPMVGLCYLAVRMVQIGRDPLHPWRFLGAFFIVLLSGILVLAMFFL